MRNSDVTDEELMTAPLVKPRPLTYQSANPQDDISVTPKHLLYGQTGCLLMKKQQEAYHPFKQWQRSRVQEFKNLHLQP